MEVKTRLLHTKMKKLVSVHVITLHCNILLQSWLSRKTSNNLHQQHLTVSIVNIMSLSTPLPP